MRSQVGIGVKMWHPTFFQPVNFNDVVGGPTRIAYLNIEVN